MLTRFHKILLGLLAVQVVLIAIVMTRGNDSGALKERLLVPGFDVAKVTRVQVSSSGEGAKTIDLVKKDAGWVVASSFDYPADQAKVTDALTPITKLAAAAPIATQAGRHKQLKVADGDFERKLVITRDGKDVTLYIGGSAGARRTAFRVSGEDSVYGVTGLSIGVIGTEPRQWVDASYVKVNKDEVAKVTVARGGTTVVLQKSAPPPPAGTGSGSASGSASGSGAGSGSAAGLDDNPPAPPAAEHWSATVGGAPVTLAAGELIDEATIDRLVSEVTSLDLSAPADPKRDASKPTATITVDRKASGTSAAPTVIDVILDGSSYWVHDRSAPRAVLVDKARLDELVNVDRDKVVKKPPPPPAPPAGIGSGAGARPPGAPGAATGALTPPMPGAPGAGPRPPGGAAPPMPARPATPPPAGAATGAAAKPPAGATAPGSPAKPPAGSAAPAPKAPAGAGSARPGGT